MGQNFPKIKISCEPAVIAVHDTFGDAVVHMINDFADQRYNADKQTLNQIEQRLLDIINQYECKGELQQCSFCKSQRFYPHDLYDERDYVLGDGKIVVAKHGRIMLKPCESCTNLRRKEETS